VDLLLLASAYLRLRVYQHSIKVQHKHITRASSSSAHPARANSLFYAAGLQLVVCLCVTMVHVPVPKRLHDVWHQISTSFFSSGAVLHALLPPCLQLRKSQNFIAPLLITQAGLSLSAMSCCPNPCHAAPRGNNFQTVTRQIQVSSGAPR
jgi:hypothetical protein